jgi:hypothetical protein
MINKSKKTPNVHTRISVNKNAARIPINKKSEAIEREEKD